MRINCLTGTKMTPNVMCKESQPNLIVPVPTQGCLFFYCMCSCSMGHSWLQGNQFTMVWISIIWCVYKIYKCIYKLHKYIKHNRHSRDCFVPFWNTECENSPSINRAAQLEDSRKYPYPHMLPVSHHLVPCKLPEAVRYLCLSLIHHIPSVQGLF